MLEERRGGEDRGWGPFRADLLQPVEEAGIGGLAAVLAGHQRHEAAGREAGLVEPDAGRGAATLEGQIPRCQRARCAGYGLPTYEGEGSQMSADPRAAGDQWYYLENNQQQGPVASGALAQLLAAGRLPPETLRVRQLEARTGEMFAMVAHPLHPAHRSESEQQRDGEP